MRTATPFSGHEALEKSEQEGAELAFLAIGFHKPVLGEEIVKKGLREILGIIRRVTFAAGKGVEGIPIVAAKFFEGV